MPTLLVNEDGFRIVHDVVSEQDVFTLEQRDGNDAMGQPHWRRVETKSTRMLQLLYAYILKLKTQETL
jgi:hypothetical protein